MKTCTLHRRTFRIGRALILAGSVLMANVVSSCAVDEDEFIFMPPLVTLDLTIENGTSEGISVNIQQRYATTSGDRVINVAWSECGSPIEISAGEKGNIVLELWNDDTAYDTMQLHHGGDGHSSFKLKISAAGTDDIYLAGYKAADEKFAEDELCELISWGSECGRGAYLASKFLRVDTDIKEIGLGGDEPITVSAVLSLKQDRTFVFDWVPSNWMP